MNSKALASAIAVGVIAAVGVAAVVDAVVSGNSDRKGGSSPKRDAEASPRSASLEATLAEKEIRGILYYSDPADDCRLRAVEVPSLDQVPPPKLRACQFELPPSPGSRALAEGAAWSPDGRLAATCRKDRVVVSTPTGAPVAEIPGCAPAWRPDGTLTAIRDGEVWCVRTPSNDMCEQKLLSTADLERGARRDPLVPAPRYLRTVDAVGVAWLTGRRAALAIRFELRGRAGRLGPLGALAFYRGNRLVAFQPYTGLGGLRVSPTRRIIAVREADAPVAMLTSAGRRLPASNPALRDAVAITWSPDERWTAIATRWSVFLVPTDDLLEVREPRLIQLPIAARDLAWR